MPAPSQERKGLVHFTSVVKGLAPRLFRLRGTVQLPASLWLKKKVMEQEIEQLKTLVNDLFAKIEVKAKKS